MKRFLALAFLATFPRPTFGADVYLVDSSGAGDFLDLQVAVDVAADGDTILLRRPPEASRHFGPVVVEGKALSFVNVRNGELAIERMLVRGLAADQAVVVSGLTVGQEFGSPSAPPLPALELVDCRGPVRIQQCRVQSTRAIRARRAGPACSIRDSRDVVFVGCQLLGGNGSGELRRGGNGLNVFASRVIVYDSHLEGGWGGSITFPIGEALGGHGGHGATVSAGFLHLVSSTLAGGSGGAAYFSQVAIGGDGGDGIRIGSAAVATALESEFAGGDAGEGDSQYGAPGTAVVGALDSFATPSPALTAPQRGEEGAAVALRVRGEAGDRVFLLTSSAPATRFLDPRLGALHVAEPFQRIELGAVPLSGVLEVDYTLPQVSVGEVAELLLQPCAVHPGGRTRLGNPVHVFVSDALAPPVCGRRLHVDANALAGGDGTSWPQAFRDLNDALRASADCVGLPTEVWIAEGIYRPQPAGGDPSVPFRVYSGTHLYGGFAGDELHLDQRDAHAHPVVLSGDLSGDDAPGFAGRDDNSFNVVRIGARGLPDERVRIDGVTIRGGRAINANVSGGGGGLAVYGAAAVVGCDLVDNLANYGAGIFLEGTSLQVESCRMVGNRANQGGGLWAGETVLQSSVVPLARVVVNNSVVAGNSQLFSTVETALRVFGDTELLFSNSVYYANEGRLLGGNFETRVSNSILWDNGGASQSDQLSFFTGSLDHSCVQGFDGSVGGEGSLGLDPAFVDRLGPDGVAGTLDDDLRPGPGSPCVDAGRNADVLPDVFDLDGDGNRGEPVPFDLQGDARLVDDPAAPDTGDGAAPLVDMGPFERQP